jgi:hypothetical protein
MSDSCGSVVKDTGKVELFMECKSSANMFHYFMARLLSPSIKPDTWVNEPELNKILVRLM